jgi:hypothetical protein
MHGSEMVSDLMTKWPDLPGYAAVICTLVDYMMKTMNPLRIAEIAANCLFLSYLNLLIRSLFCIPFCCRLIRCGSIK